MLSVNHDLTENTKLFKCSRCGRAFNYKTGLLNHELYECSKESTYSCSECPYESVYRRCLVRHLKIIHSRRPFKNPEGADKQFPCPQCKRNFDRNHKLELHLKKVCGKQKSQECPECPQRCTNRQDLLRHIRRRHGQEALDKYKPRKSADSFTCFQCGRSFTRKSSLGHHLNTYCGKEPTIQCPHCPKKYFTLHILKNHSVQTHGKEAWQTFQNQHHHHHV